MKTSKLSLITLPLAILSLLSVGACDTNIPNTEVSLQPTRTIDLVTEKGDRVPLVAGQPREATLGVTVTTKTIWLKFPEGKVEFKKLKYNKQEEIVSSDPSRSRAESADGEKLGIIADRDYINTDTDSYETTESCTIYEQRWVEHCYDRPSDHDDHFDIRSGDRRDGRDGHDGRGGWDDHGHGGRECRRELENVAVGTGRQDVEVTTTTAHYQVDVTLTDSRDNALAKALGNYDDVKTSRSILSSCR